MEGVEAEGRTVNEATEKALEQLGLRREDVQIEVLTQGRARLLGFRGEPARVRVMPLPPRPAPAPAPRAPYVPIEAEEEEGDEGLEDEELEDESAEEGDEEYEDEGEGEEELPPELQRQAPIPVAALPAPVPVNPEDVAAAVGVLENLLQLMGVEATVASREPETAGDGIGMMEAVLDIEGEDLGVLIGRRGQTLMSLQYLLNLIVSKQANRRVAFAVDVDSYRRRREEALVSLARRTASRVRGTGRSVTLEPMPPNERRIIHLALQEDPAVMTVSIGEGEDRKVAITPTR